MEYKRPNTKGLVSRSFRRSTVSIRILNVDQEDFRTLVLEDIMDEPDPIKTAREMASKRMSDREMIVRADMIKDGMVVYVMTPEEFRFRGRVLEYIPIKEAADESTVLDAQRPGVCLEPLRVEDGPPDGGA